MAERERRDPHTEQYWHPFINLTTVTIGAYELVRSIGFTTKGFQDYLLCTLPTIADEYSIFVNDSRPVGPGSAGICTPALYPALVAHDSSVTPGNNESWGPGLNGRSLLYRIGGWRVLGTPPNGPANTVVAIKEPWLNWRGLLTEDMTASGTPAGTGTLTLRGKTATISATDSSATIATTLTAAFGTAVTIPAGQLTGLASIPGLRVEFSGSLSKTPVEQMVPNSGGGTLGALQTWISLDGYPDMEYLDVNTEEVITVPGRNTIHTIRFSNGSAEASVQYRNSSDVWTATGLSLKVLDVLGIAQDVLTNDIVYCEFDQASRQFVLNATGGCG